MGLEQEGNCEQWLNIMSDVVLSEYMPEHLKNVPILGTMAEESRIRRQGWIRTGCNAFDGIHSKSQPMSFWTEQDVLSYIVKYKIDIPSVYGDIVLRDKDGLEYPTDMYDFAPQGSRLVTTGAARTGCIFCGFGFHLEKGETRFQRLKKLIRNNIPMQ